MKTTVNFFRTLLLAVLTLTFGACGEDSLLSELGLDGQTSTKVDGAGEVWDGTVAERFAGGSGTAEDPYQIANGAQLAKLAQDVNGGNNYAGTYFVLTADILLNDTEGWESWNESTKGLNTWTPIGNSSQPFTGTLDGAGHSVSGIYINSTEIYQGLVGYLGSGGTLQNLGVKASYIKGVHSVGGLCGWNDGTVTNCYNAGSVTGDGYVGGVCGMNMMGNVTNCYNTGNVTGSDAVGGVCGQNQGNVTNCYNTGSVTGSYYVGGVCGQNDGTVTNCYNTGSVTGSHYVGGVCGQNYGTVTNCYNTGNVTGNDAYVGGLCGQNYATVSNCYYLAGKANSGIGEGSGEATEKTADEFASGEVAWLLQGEQEGQVWGQTIGTDEYPVLGGEKVLQIGDGYANELKQDGDFYLISTADELRLFASMVNSGQTNINGRLTADILLNDISDWENWNESTEGLNRWTPIGSGSQPFTGTLDGDGHSVSGIYISSTANYQGLVGFLDNDGTLQNLGVKASYIKGGHSVGGVCGMNVMGTVTNCYNSGNVAGTGDYVGGVCGMNVKGNVINCYNTGSVTGSKQVGGVCGGNESGNVTNCYNTGSVTGSYYVGGVCGRNYSATVTNCYNTGNVTGNDAYVGGVCGYNYGDTVTNCYYLTGTAAGGINGNDAAGQAEVKTAEQFKSGEVASLLGEGWGQTISTDDYPVLDADGAKRVYAVTLYQGSDAADARYLNGNGTFPTLTGNAIALVDAGSPFSSKNIVVKDGDSYTCDNLVLTDGADFYTPVPFTATNATYTRKPSVWATNNGSGSGWETICLPFSGTLYAGEEAKEPVDVASNNGAYWLRSLTGFETPNTLIFASPAMAADNQIKAGVPYIIALPGTSFGDESLEGQTISVRGTGVTVLTTAARIQPEGSMFAFTGTFATKACDAASYRLNSENGSDGAGDLFVLDTKELAPFRCRIDVTGFNIDGASTRSASGLPKELRIGQ